MIITKRPGGDTASNMNLYLIKYYRPLVTCTVVHLLWNIVRNNLIPCMHHYSFYYIRTFLQILIFINLASNTAINASTSSRVSNLWVTLFSSKLATIYEICIITSEPSFGATKFSNIGYTDILWIGEKDTGHTKNITWTNMNTSHS